MPGNVYFELTRTFNARGPIVALASRQAVVHYRVAIMSKDGDSVPADQKRLPEAHGRVLALAERLLPFTVDLPEEPDGDAQ